MTFEQMVAARSTTKAGRAKKSYYGIDIHELIDQASKEQKKATAPKARQQVRCCLLWRILAPSRIEADSHVDREVSSEGISWNL